jgi:hypothetical protein
LGERFKVSRGSCKIGFEDRGVHNMLTSEQRAALDDAGTEIVRIQLFQYGAGRDTVVDGFKCEPVRRGDLEDWLAQKTRDEALQQSNILFWAKVAGWAAILGVIAALVGIGLPIVLHK